MNGYKHVINEHRLNNKHELNNVVQPLLTDLYQITMAYSYWKAKKFDNACFDVLFRKNPFNGEFTVFAGLDECLKFMRNFHFTQSDIDYLRSAMPSYIEDEFYEYLHKINLNDIKLTALPEGSLVFPRVPIVRVEGPLPIAQLLETTLLVLINYASLVTTNAARFRLAAGNDKQLLEFGLRRAQGPDGGLTASKYCYIGGFDATSNVLAGKLYNIPIRGTNAHSYVTSFLSLNDLRVTQCVNKNTQKLVDLRELSEMFLSTVCNLLGCSLEQCNKGELAAFISYAIAFPSDFLVLVDTYSVLQSGLPNFCAVSLALNELGYRSCGIRLDSGDLAYLSKEVRKIFVRLSNHYNLTWFSKLTIVASNDINEDILHSLHIQANSIDSYGIGTHLVTCQKQPALGCVYKLVEVNGKACFKLSEDPLKVTFPGKKNAYRLFDKENVPIVDLLTMPDELAPEPSKTFLCRHPFVETKRAYIVPSRVEQLYVTYWENGHILNDNVDSLEQVRKRVCTQLNSLRDDHKRMLYPTPYKISVSEKLYDFMHKLWLDYTPIGELN